MTRWQFIGLPLGVVALLLLVVGQTAGFSSGWIASWPRELGAALIVLLGAWAVGRRVLAFFLPGEETAGARHLQLALGLGVFILVALILGLGGLLDRRLLASVALLAAAGGLTDLGRSWWQQRASLRPASWGQLADLPLTVVLGAVFLFATLPPAFYDAITYHLGLPSLYLASGALVYPDAFSLASYPQNAELLSAWAMALGGEKGAQLLGYLLAVACTLALRDFATRRFGRVAGSLAALLLASSWFFVFEAALAKNDLLGGYFFFLSLIILVELPTRRRGILLSGVLAGLAVGVKFSNLLPLFLVSSFLVWLRADELSRVLRRYLVWTLLALAVASPWMVRNVVHRGNPLFPAFYSLLGGDGWTEENAARMRSSTGSALDRSPGAIASRWVAIGWRHAAYGSGGEVTFFFLPMLILGIAACRRRADAALLSLALVTLLLGTAFFSSYLRIYAIAMISAPLAAAALYRRWEHLVWRVAVGGLLVLLVALQLGASSKRIGKVTAGGFRVIRGELGENEYLDGLLNYLPMARRIGQELPQDAKILLVGSARTTYIPRVCYANYAWDDPWINRALEPDANPELLVASLVADGFTHILLNAADLRELERNQQLFRVSNDASRRARLNAFFASLHKVAEENDCYLFSTSRGDDSEPAGPR